MLVARKAGTDVKVKLENLTKKWGDVVGALDVSLEIEDGEFVAFLGPSGCGKTTTLLMIAGIYKPTAGTIDFDGQIVNELPPKDRHIGMVFQSYALYPHMSVYGNISYPLKLQKVPKPEIKDRVQRVAVGRPFFAGKGVDRAAEHVLRKALQVPSEAEPTTRR